MLYFFRINWDDKQRFIQVFDENAKIFSKPHKIYDLSSSAHAHHQPADSRRSRRRVALLTMRSPFCSDRWSLVVNLRRVTPSAERAPAAPVGCLNITKRKQLIWHLWCSERIHYKHNNRKKMVKVKNETNIWHINLRISYETVFVKLT